MASAEKSVHDHKIVDKTELASTRWLRLVQFKYQDPHGVERVWDSAERTTTSSGLDGVAIFATLKKHDMEDRVVLVAQFRVPIGKVCLELPAGLVDSGETAEAAAAREMKEETGYTGTITAVSGVIYNDPGMSNASHRIVTMEVDCDAPENANPLADVQAEEFIEVLTVPKKHLLAEIEKRSTAMDWAVEAGLYTLALAYP